MTLSPKQRKLFDSLRRLEGQGARLPRAEFLAVVSKETGYKEVSTYLSKYLGGVVRRAADDRLEVRGVVPMSEEDFARLLTQKRLGGEASALHYDSRDEWADAMRALARHGADRQYRVDPDDVAFMRSLFPAEP